MIKVDTTIAPNKREITQDDFPVFMRCKQKAELVVLFVEEERGIIINHHQKTRSGKIESGFFNVNNNDIWELVPAHEKFTLSNT